MPGAARLEAERGQAVVCGHSGAVSFRKWDELAASHPGLHAVLPPGAVPDLRAFATGFARGECSMDDLGRCRSGAGTEGGGFSPAELPTCAVVGNSGKLRGEFHREAIDASDVVIRFNGGVTRGYEEHVGTKSTFRLYNGPYTTPHVPGEATIAQIRDVLHISGASPRPVGGQIQPDPWIATSPFQPGNVEQQ